jgi:glycosyltransferase involved in cell wall biosynthesis
MKVLQVIDSLSLGGAEVLVAEMYSGLRKRGIECEYYLLRCNKTSLEQKLLLQGAVIHAPITVSVYSPIHILALRRHLRAFEYDVVHVHLFPAQLWAACGARAAHITTPLVTTEHSTQTRRRTRCYRLIDRWMYGQYRRVAAVSRATMDNLLTWLPKLRGKVTVCSNGVNVDAFASAATADKQTLFSISADLQVVICVGRLETVKGHETLLHAINLVPDVVLALVGDGRLLRQLGELADKLGILSRVRFLGSRTDVPLLLKAADVYVQPSRWEGYGIAALEAMAARKPVVASDVPGLAEVVGDAGLLFTPGDAGQLAEKIAMLLGDAPLRRRLGDLAHERAIAFGIDNTLDCYDRLYRNVLGENDG